MKSEGNPLSRKSVCFLIGSKRKTPMVKGKKDI